MKITPHISFSLLTLFAAGNLFAEKPGWTTYKPDRTIKARNEVEFRDNRIFKIQVFDSEGRPECILYPTYDESGKRIGQTKTLPDARPWPYRYAIYGAAALGGIDKLAEDIKLIEEGVAKRNASPILEILFLSSTHVKVMTGIVKGPLNGSGQYHSFKKEGSSWYSSDKNGLIHSWNA